MGRSIRHLLVFGFVLMATAVIADPFPAGQDVPHAIPGDGAVDAPVPAVGALGGPTTALAGPDLQKWLRGRELFDRNFKPSEGCGTPELNADSCRACHQDPVIGGSGGLELNVSRFGFDDDGQGPFVDLTGGQPLSVLRPPLTAGREEYGDTADVFEQRQTPALFGAGLIDMIPEGVILANEDPGDGDMDMIAGVARMIDVGGGLMEVGRFGWKGQVPHLRDFIHDAMGGELGLTTPSDGLRGFAFVSDADGVAEPEFTAAQIDDMLFFLANLAPPPMGAVNDPARAQGEALFDTLGCAKCHIPNLGGVGLFSDLLLHDVAPDLFRGMAEPGAASGMYRTPPLWGNCHTAPYMHDGSAETVEAAILSHFGEADLIRQAYLALPQQEKDALLLFLSDI